MKSNTTIQTYLFMLLHTQDPCTSIKITQIKASANIIGTSNVVLACMKYNVKLVYISTDYVSTAQVETIMKMMHFLLLRGSLTVLTSMGGQSGGECAVRMYDNL